MDHLSLTTLSKDENTAELGWSMTDVVRVNKIPPTNSPEVQAWMQSVANSDISIPGLVPTVDGESQC
jgi:hypothetical protein